MIVSLTPNPSLDRTIEVDRLERGAVIRARATRVDAGGKGVNVARALHACGMKAVAVLPSGGGEGLQLTAMLAADNISVVEVPIEGSVRANVTVVEPDGTTTKLNEPGPRLSGAEITALVHATTRAAADAEWGVICGSLPRGVPHTTVAKLVGSLRGAGVRVAVDSSGAALAAAVTARPDLIKPNAEELAELSGRSLRTLGDVVDAAQSIREKGVVAVLASLGRDGAVLVDAGGTVHAEAAVVLPRSTVGAGDAMLAGFLAAGGAGDAALAEAVAWGAAAAALPGSRMPAPEDLDRDAVRLHRVPDRERRLHEGGNG